MTNDHHSKRRDSSYTIPEDQYGSHRVVYPRGDPRDGNRRLLRIGWIFLGVVLALSVLAIVFLLLPQEKEAVPTVAADTVAPPSEVYAQATAVPEKPKKEEKKADSPEGGRPVEISGVSCDFTPPETLTFGVLKSIDFSSIGGAIAQNAAAAGWGSIDWSAGDTLLLTAAERVPLLGSEYEAQEAFLASDRPEALARTFLQDSGILTLLQSYGLSFSTECENKDGEITFTGTGSSEQSECSIRFSFHYTGAFNQASLRAVYLDGEQTTSDVLPLKKAAANALTWSSAAPESAPSVTSASIRSIRGLPFYVLGCADGTTAYALAIDEKALAASPEAQEVYAAMLRSGIQEYIETPGAGF